MDMGLAARRAISPVTQGKIGAFSQDSVAEATIKDITNGVEVKCLFRPHDYTFVKRNSWEAAKIIGATMDPPQFKGGDPITLSLDLLFDTNEFPPGQQDVRLITNKLWDMMKVTEKRKHPITQKSEPPWVEFRWGKTWSFTAVITSISQQFTLFMPNGTPVRSKVKIDFLQAKDNTQFPFQNPTSGGREGFNVHIVKDGETIDWIAFEEYGNPNAWRHLASANRLDDPSRLQPGQRLLLVPVGE